MKRSEFEKEVLAAVRETLCSVEPVRRDQIEGVVARVKERIREPIGRFADRKEYVEGALDLATETSARLRETLRKSSKWIEERFLGAPFFEDLASYSSWVGPMRGEANSLLAEAAPLLVEPRPVEEERS